MAALEWGFHPVKLNAVVMRGFNDDEIERIAGLVLTYPVHVRFIEYMPIGTDPQAARRHFIPMDTVERRLNAMGELTAIASQPNDGPARRFRLAGALGEIGLIASMSRHFCSTCNRLRLTASGGLRPCLLADAQVELLGPLRRGADDDALAALFRQALALKRVEHRLDFNGGVPLQGQMFRIGG
jgi:cyclic pyranopterin phosphate synthase